MANTKVTGDVIANGTISTVHIADDAITAAKLDSTATGITFADLAVDTDTLYVDSANNRVGIGTSSPSYKLGLSNSNTLTAVYQQFTNGTTGTTSSDGTVMGIDADGDFLINNQEAKEIKLYTSDTQRLTIQSGGNVGIGTTSPSRALDVRGDAQILSTGATGLRIVGGTTNEVYMIFGDADDNSMGGFGYDNNTNELSIDVNNAERMRIDNSGNVGIGTTDPERRLTVGDGNGSEIISIYAGTTSTSAIHFTDTNTSTDYQGFVSYNHNVDALRLGTAETERMRIDSSGKVGIGTTSPGTKLHINESTANTPVALTVESASWDSTLKLKNGNGTWEILNDYTGLGTNATLAFYNSGYRMVIENTGNIGIGTTSPSTKLHIEGATVGYLQTIKNTTAGGDYLQMLAETGDPVFQFQSTGTGGEATLNMYRDGTQYVKISADAGVNNYFNNGANVGIGTASPVVKLNVVGSAYFSGNDAWNGGGSEGNKTDIALVIDEGDTIYTRDSNQYLRTLIKKDTGDNIQIGEAGTSLIDNINFFSGSSCSYTWYNNSSAAMKLTSTGLGIGTTSPIAQLDVSGNTNQHHSASTTHNGGWRNIQNLGATGWLDQTYSAGRIKVFGYENSNVNVSYCEYYVIRSSTGYHIQQIGTRVGAGNGHGQVQVQVSGNYLQVKNDLSSSLGAARVVFSGMKD